MKSIVSAMAALALSVAPAVLAQPYPSSQPAPGYQGYPGPGYQGQPAPDQGYPSYAPPSDEPPYSTDQNQRDAQQYDRSEDTYEQQLRQYQHDRREYDRQRDAYDAQFGARDASAYPPPPPPSPDADSYRFSETIPFHDGPWEDAYRGGAWYRDHGCRLATPHEGADADDGRLIPVCPDSNGRYHPGY